MLPLPKNQSLAQDPQPLEPPVATAALGGGEAEVVAAGGGVEVPVPVGIAAEVVKIKRTRRIWRMRTHKMKAP